MEKQSFTIILFYRYTKVANPEGFMNWNKELGSKLGLTGRILIASEGINATLEGRPESIATYIEHIRKQNYADLSDPKTAPIKESAGTGSAFPNLKVKVRKEIVALVLGAKGEEDIDPNILTGIHLPPENLKKWYENDEDFIVFDMRNDYEYKVGHFKNSINPGMNNFRELPEVLSKVIEKDPQIINKKVLTVCTGGVRCEKASGYLLKKGFKDVYQLDGGMHMFMEKFPGQKGQEFEGALYTFDNRITMDFLGGNQGLELDGEKFANDSVDEVIVGENSRKIVGLCDVCKQKTERFTHCANDMCHQRLLVCENCEKTHTYIWCSKDCQEHGRIGLINARDLSTSGVTVAM